MAAYFQCAGSFPGKSRHSDKNASHTCSCQAPGFTSGHQPGALLIDAAGAPIFLPVSGYAKLHSLISTCHSVFSTVRRHQPGNREIQLLVE